MIPNEKETKKLKGQIIGLKIAKKKAIEKEKSQIIELLKDFVKQQEILMGKESAEKEHYLALKYCKDILLSTVGFIERDLHRDYPLSRNEQADN